MHYDIVHGGLSEYECDHCQMKFTELAHLKKHIVFNHPISDHGSKYKLCQICNLGNAYTEAKFTQHLLNEHFPHIHRQLQNMPYPRDELTLRQNNYFLKDCPVIFFYKTENMLLLKNTQILRNHCKTLCQNKAFMSTLF